MGGLPCSVSMEGEWEAVLGPLNILSSSPWLAPALQIPLPSYTFLPFLSEGTGVTRHCGCWGVTQALWVLGGDQALWMLGKERRAAGQALCPHSTAAAR